jgi:hypothetical protein
VPVVVRECAGVTSGQRLIKHVLVVRLGVCRPEVRKVAHTTEREARSGWPDGERREARKVRPPKASAVGC